MGQRDHRDGGAGHIDAPSEKVDLDRAVRRARLRRGIAASAASRAIAILAPLVTIPFALHHLGASAFGAWSAAIALTGFAAFADLGFGAGLMTRLAALLTEQDHVRAREVVSSAYVAVFMVIGGLLAGLWLSSVWVDYGKFVGSPGATRVMSNIVLVTLTVFLLNVGVSLIVRVQYAAQQIARSNIWQCAGSIAGVLATAVAATTSAGAPLFIAIATGAPVAVGVVNSIHFFRNAGRPYRPALHAYRADSARMLLKIGTRFLTINILIAATMTTDSLIVANTVDLEAAANYAIPARVFSVMAVATAVLAGPLWPINVEAMKHGDIGWVRSTTKKMAMLTSAAALVLGSIGVVVGPAAISLWLGGKITPSAQLLIGLAACLLVQAATSPFFMVQNAAVVLAPQIVGYALLTLTIPIKWLVSSAVGFEYIPYVGAIGFVVFIWPAVYVGYKKAIHR